MERARKKVIIDDDDDEEDEMIVDDDDDKDVFSDDGNSSSLDGAIEEDEDECRQKVKPSKEKKRSPASTTTSNTQKSHSISVSGSKTGGKNGVKRKLKSTTTASNGNGKSSSNSIKESKKRKLLEAGRRDAKIEFEEYRAGILSKIPKRYKDMFGQIGLTKWNKGMTPVLIMSPFQVPPGGVRNMWINMFEKKNKANSLLTMSYLIYWYGATDHSSMFGFIAQNSFVPYEKEEKKGSAGSHLLPPKLRQRVDNGLSLNTKDKEKINAYREMEEDLKLEPHQRKRGIIDFPEVYELLKLTDVDDIVANADDVDVDDDEDDDEDDEIVDDENDDDDEIDNEEASTDDGEELSDASSVLSEKVKENPINKSKGNSYKHSNHNTAKIERMTPENENKNSKNRQSKSEKSAKSSSSKNIDVKEEGTVLTGTKKIDKVKKKINIKDDNDDVDGGSNESIDVISTKKRKISASIKSKTETNSKNSKKEMILQRKKSSSSMKDDDVDHEIENKPKDVKRGHVNSKELLDHEESITGKATKGIDEKASKGRKNVKTKSEGAPLSSNLQQDDDDIEISELLQPITQPKKSKDKKVAATEKERGSVKENKKKESSIRADTNGKSVTATTTTTTTTMAKDTAKHKAMFDTPDVDVDDEQLRFQECEQRYLAKINRWKECLEENDIIGLQSIITDLVKIVDKFSAPFVQVYNILSLIKQTESADLQDTTFCFKLLKANLFSSFAQKKQRVPKNFKPVQGLVSIIPLQENEKRMITTNEGENESKEKDNEKNDEEQKNEKEKEEQKTNKDKNEVSKEINNSKKKKKKNKASKQINKLSKLMTEEDNSIEDDRKVMCNDKKVMSDEGEEISDDKKEMGDDEKEMGDDENDIVIGKNGVDDGKNTVYDGTLTDYKKKVKEENDEEVVEGNITEKAELADLSVVTIKQSEECIKLEVDDNSAKIDNIEKDFKKSDESTFEDENKNKNSTIKSKMNKFRRKSSCSGSDEEIEAILDNDIGDGNFSDDDAAVRDNIGNGKGMEHSNKSNNIDLLENEKSISNIDHVTKKKKLGTDNVDTVNTKRKIEKPMSDRGKIQREHNAFKSCQVKYLPLIEKWKANLECDNVEKLKEVIDEVSEVVSEFSASFMEVYGLSELLKGTKHLFKREDVDLTAWVNLREELKQCYKEKSALVPKGFTPKISEHESSTKIGKSDSSVKEQISTEKSTENSSGDLAVDLKNPSKTRDISKTDGVSKSSSSSNIVDAATKKHGSSSTETLRTDAKNNSSGRTSCSSNNPPKPERKKFSLSSLMNPSVKDTTERDSEPSSSHSKTKVIKLEHQRKQVDENVVPSWAKDLNLSALDTPKDDPRLLALEFLLQMAGRFPEGKVNVDAVARSIEAAIYHWAKSGTGSNNSFTSVLSSKKGVSGLNTNHSGRKNTDINKKEIDDGWITRYWSKVHAIVASVCGKRHDNSGGTLMMMILRGHFPTPEKLLQLSDDDLIASFEGRPLAL